MLRDYLEKLKLFTQNVRLNSGRIRAIFERQDLRRALRAL
jgi:hypothetical protein